MHFDFLEKYILNVTIFPLSEDNRSIFAMTSDIFNLGF